MVDEVEPIAVRRIILAWSYSPSGILMPKSERGDFKQVCLMTEWKQVVWHYG